MRERPAGAGRDDGERSALAQLEVAVVEHRRGQSPARPAHIVRGRFRPIALIVHLGMLQTLERGEGLGLRERRHAPCADRSADELDPVRMLQPFHVQQAIERQQGQAFGSAGCGGDAGDVSRRQPASLDVGDRGRPAAKREIGSLIHHWIATGRSRVRALPIRWLSFGSGPRARRVQS
jgi:hypothetical protein